MDQNTTENRHTTHLITKIEDVIGRAVLQERERWAAPYKALQNEIKTLRSQNVLLSIQVQRYQLESTNRALWLKRKAKSDALEGRPAKLPRREDSPLQGAAPPTPNSLRAYSADVDDVAGGLEAGPADSIELAPPATQSGATSLNRRIRPIAQLPSKARAAIQEHTTSSPCPRKEHDLERVVYCLCGGHEYELMIRCDSPKCELVWFHATCVGLKEVPGEEEEWFCPACVEPRSRVRATSLGRFTTVGIQTTTVPVDAGCQTNPEAPIEIPSPPLNGPQKCPSTFASLQPRTSREKHQLSPLSPFVPQPRITSVLHAEHLDLLTPVPSGQIPSDSTPTPLATMGSQESTTDPEASINLFQDQSILIHITSKLIGSSRKSLFRSLQPTAQKPWIDNPEAS